METLNITDRNDFLMDFVDKYLDVFFALASDGLKLPVDKFYEKLFYEVSLDTKLRVEEVRQLHHPFHWALISENRKSPFEYVQPRIPGDFSHIGTKRAINQNDRNNLKQKIVEDYKDILLSKLEFLINNPLRQGS